MYQKGIVFVILILFVGMSMASTTANMTRKVSDKVMTELANEKQYSTVKGFPVYLDDLESNSKHFEDFIYEKRRTDIDMVKPAEISVSNTMRLLNGNTLYVGGSGSDNYTSIQDAIDNASGGDTVYVYSGIYYENVLIDKSLSLIGEDKNITIIDGGNYGDVIQINIDEVTITGFSIQNSGFNWFPEGPDIDAGIQTTAGYNIIKNNIFTNNVCGIHLVFSSNTIIEENIINNNHVGIYPYYSENDVISRNLIIYNNFGIDENPLSPGHTMYLNINNNTINYNYRGLTVVMGAYGSISNNDISNNIAIGCIFYFFNYNYICNNTILNNDDIGILMEASDYNVITKNVIKYNGNGLNLIFNTDENIIFENQVVSNNGYGIYIEFFQSPYGTEESNNNILYHNYFDYNILNTRDECSNIWDDGYISGGNYWSDFDEPIEGAYDNNSDGRVDSPYYIPNVSNLDRFPLVEPWNGIPAPQPMCGDASNDGTVDIDDVVYLIAYIFSGGPAPFPAVCVGDANGDDVVDIDDVVYLISYIFSNGPAPVDTCCD